MKKSIHSSEQGQLLALLREARKKAGLSQTELARRLGRTQSYISKYEMGELRLDLLELRSVCKALGVSLSTLVREFEKRTS
ncbi:MAG: helix-turn-helix domain-containing protein [Planctomycetota bacterium]|jgi:transcriptional regulator with XRE-family HTH domain